MKVFLIYIFLLFYIGLNAQSNRLHHKIYTKQDGLEIDIIKTMSFDDDGFLWLGGESLDNRTIILSNKRLSIQRFNGSFFHEVFLPQFNEQLISIDQIYKRTDGKFYIVIKAISGYYLCLFNPVTTKFTKVKLSNDSFLVEGASNIFFYEGKEYLIIKKGEKVIINIITKELALKPLFDIPIKNIRFNIESALKFIPFKEYCIISDDNFPLIFFDWDGNVIKRFPLHTFIKKEENRTSKVWIDEMFVKDGITYVFLYNNPNLYYIDEEAMDILPVNAINNSLERENLCVYTDPFGNSITLTSENQNLGIHFFETEGFSTLKKTEIFENTTSLRAVSKNLKKDIWIATGSKELHYFKFPSEAIKTYLPNNSIRSIAKLNNENIIVATETDGWHLFNEKTKNITPFSLFENEKTYVPFSSRNIVLDTLSIWSNTSSSLIEVDKKTLNVKTYRHFPVICLEKLNDSTLVYGTFGYNLMSFNTNTKKHTPIIATDSLNIYDIAIHNNYLVGATNKGILTYNFINESSAFINDKETLNDPFFLMVDYNKNLGFVLGSRSGNVATFNPENNRYNVVYKDPLQAGIATIIYDKEMLWINTFNGVVAYNTKDNITNRFSEKDGLSNNEANRYSAFKTQNGYFVGTIKGLNYFNPDDIVPEEDASKLMLLKINKFDVELNKYKDIFNRSTFTSDNVIFLPSENRALELDFSLNNCIATNDNSFRYRLDKGEWINLKNRQSISFPNLASGNYALEIEALNFSGKKIAQPLLIQIDVENFFYKTWWFYLLVFLGSISFLLWLLKQNQLRRKLQEQFSQDLILSQEQERTRIARELHDSVGQQLTLIKKKAQNVNQEDITNLTHNALEEVRSISRGLYPAVLKQLGLSESIEELLNELDAESEIFFSLEIDDINNCFNEERTLNYYRFIQECMSNVLKHSEAKSVLVTIKKQKGTVLTIIEDNGKGFDLSSKLLQNSLGLKTITERIKILNGAINIQSKLEKGTIINAEIPFKNE